MLNLQAHAAWRRWRKGVRAERPAVPPPVQLPPELSKVLLKARWLASWLLALIVIAATGASFAESYRALVDWAQRHGLHGIWADIFPLQIDTFVVAGEVAVFLTILHFWPQRYRRPGWAVSLIGLGASVLGNIGHISAHTLQDRGTAAVPPLAAFFALAVGMGILKRVVMPPGRAAGETVPAADPGETQRQVAETVAEQLALQEARQLDPAAARYIETKVGSMRIPLAVGAPAAVPAPTAVAVLDDLARTIRPQIPAQAAPPVAPAAPEPGRPKRTPPAARPKLALAPKPDTGQGGRAEAVRFRAEHPDMTQEQIAEHFGVSARTLRRWLSGPKPDSRTEEAS
jgi:hypothetical protein